MSIEQAVEAILIEVRQTSGNESGFRASDLLADDYTQGYVDGWNDVVRIIREYLIEERLDGQK